MADELTVLGEDGTTSIGTVRRAGDELSLTYTDGYVGTPVSTSMSPNQPSHDEVSPTLWGLLPDNDRVLERWAREASVSPRDLAGLLGHYGADVAGAMTYRDAGADAAEAPTGYDPIDEIDIERRLADLRSDESAWHGSTGGRWSLGGAQGKFTLARLEDGWSVPRGAAASTHIVKPGVVGLEGHEMNEHVCLRAAAALGLHVARSELVTFGSQRAIVVERYDRRTIDGEVVRIHQEDMCQALRIHPIRKYQSEGGPGIADIGRVIAAVSDRAGDDRWRFAEMLAFNWLIGGSDAHAKNYSLVLRGGRARLAPMYDVGSLLPHEHPRKVSLAMKMGGEYKIHKIEARHWAGVASDLELDENRLLIRIGEMAGQLPDAAADAGRQAPDSSVVVDAIASWASSISTWWAASVSR